jgi:hypothetical protein
MFAGTTVQNFDQKNPAGLNPYPLSEMIVNIPDKNAFAIEMLQININRVTIGHHKKGIAIVN